MTSEILVLELLYIPAGKRRVLVLTQSHLGSQHRRRRLSTPCLSAGLWTGKEIFFTSSFVQSITVLTCYIKNSFIYLILFSTYIKIIILFSLPLVHPFNEIL